jgi:hypothetical protein
MPYKQQLITLYKGSIDKSLTEIHSALREAGLYSSTRLDSYKTILTNSSQNMIHKWESGKKYLRTEHALKAFGKTYPEPRIELSIMTDAMVNILDDLLDEQMQKEGKSLYILEFLRIFAVYSSINPDDKIQSAVCYYFHKLISLAVAEQQIMEQVKAQTNKESILKNSAKLLTSRSFDIDIFIQIPMFSLSSKENHHSILLKKARIFRALNILKKDISDMDHDIHQGQETLVTWMSKNDKYPLKQYVYDLTQDFYNKMTEDGDEIGSSSALNTAFHNLEQMIKKEIEAIQKRVNQV